EDGLLRRRRRDARPGLRRRRRRGPGTRDPARGGALVSGRTDPTGAFHSQERRIVRGAEIPGERRVRADVCVIGTGAGGAVAAKELAEGGMRVLMIEEGERFATDDFTARPREMTARLYRDAGQTATTGNVPIVMPLGSAVGG